MPEVVIPDAALSAQIPKLSASSSVVWATAIAIGIALVILVSMMMRAR
jgi:hypothetical protein